MSARRSVHRGLFQRDDSADTTTSYVYRSGEDYGDGGKDVAVLVCARELSDW